jgi:hypothetical protein
MKLARAVVLLLVMMTTGGHKHETDDMMQACTCSSSHYRNLRLCLGFQALPRAFYWPSAKKIFVECRSRHNNTHDTATFVEGWAVGRLGPSA